MVGVILTVLLGLVIVGIGDQRETGRENRCRNRLINLTLPTIQFEKSHRHYPGYAQTIEGEDRSWAFAILPQLYGNDFYDGYRDSSISEPMWQLAIFACPSVRPGEQLSAPAGNYVANTGLPDYQPTSPDDSPPDWLGNGVFYDLRERPFAGSFNTSSRLLTDAYVATGDGTGNTIMFSENLEARSCMLVGKSGYERQVGFVWSAAVDGDPPRPSPPDTLRINRGIGGDPKGESMNYARPSSNHPGIVNVSFCDGHIRTISHEIDYLVWCLLMTSRGRASRLPGRDAQGTAGPPAPAIFRVTPLDEKMIK